MGCINDIFNMILKSLNQGNQVNDSQEDSSNMLKLTSDMKQLLNDPSTPHLVSLSSLPSSPKVSPPFNVIGFKGGQTKMYTDEWRAAQAYAVFLNTLQTMQPAFKKPIKRWPRTNNLIVMPKAGMDLNAYYDGRSLRFFYGADPKTQKVVHTVESLDIVSHELGHALLDAIRPDLWNLQAIEVWSFHEAWADLVAVLTAMKHEELLKDAMKESGNDMMKSNVINRLAEEMGTTIYHYTKGKDGRKPGALREANNSFVYTQPEKLPRNAPHNKLAAECHSFGRVFLGAYYEIMARMHKREMDEGADPIQAALHVRSEASKILARAAAIAPASPRFFDSVARTMMRIVNKNNREYKEIFRSVFNDRKIIHKRSIKAQSNINLSNIDLSQHIVEKDDDSTIVLMQSPKSIRLADHFGLRAQSGNPLYACEIEVPNDSYMEFDANGNMIDSIGMSEKSAINAARECICQIYEKKMFSKKPANDGDFKKQFSIEDGKLVRNFFT